ncbi:MAG: MFS transporter [Chthoniobacteraceae bacterium]
MKPSHLRWSIAFALFMAALLNYIDRNVFGLLADTIQGDLKITNQQYATINNFFLIAYTVANLLSGWVVDKLGVRVSMALFLTWWTISNALTGFARSLGQLCGLRLLLGLGEAGCYTASPKAISEWFPVSERGTAIGFYSAGGAVGATLAPIIVALVAAHWGWRAVFAVTPTIAVVWLILWFWLYRNPGAISVQRSSEAVAANLPKETDWARWKQVLGAPVVWQLLLVRLITDPTWYFFQIWMPKYLRKEWGLSQSGLSIMWMIFLAATLGFLLGGYFSGLLVKRGSLPSAARLKIMLGSALVVPVALWIPSAPSTMAVIGTGMLVVYAATSWLSNVSSLVVDIVPKRILGTAFGVIACGSALGGVFMNKGVAWLIDQHSYNGCFYIMAFLHPVAFALVWNLRKRTSPDETAPVEAALAK